MSEEIVVSENVSKGIKETTDLLLFVLAIADAVSVSLADGSVSVLDLANFWKPASKAGEAFEGVSDVPSELGDLSGEEIDAIKAIVTQNYPGSEKILSLIFDSASNLWELVQWFKAKLA